MRPPISILTACEQLDAAGIAQYEISNFARAGSESRHNLKYWTRQPYLGFGVDAHSMLLSSDGRSGCGSLQLCGCLWNNMLQVRRCRAPLFRDAARLEEVFFLGLRLNRG